MERVVNVDWPDLSGASLSAIQSSGVDYICLTFSTLSDDKTSHLTTFIYLYEAALASADFKCAPYFPALKKVELAEATEFDAFALNITFSEGHLKIIFRGSSFHTRMHQVEDHST
jgi:hypothetical protein